MLYIVITSLNVLLHSLGCFLLWKTYKWNQITTQKLIVFHLSVAEGLFCLSILVFTALGYFPNYGESWTYLRSICFMMYFVIYFTMLFMTLDRLMAVVLSFKYQLYWRVGRTKKMLAIIWFVGFTLGVCTWIILNHTSIDTSIVLLTAFIYCQLVTSILFVVIALSTYAIIFWTYRKSRNSLRSSGSSNENGQQTTQLRFFIPVLIIFTYLIFNSVPLSIWTLTVSSSTSFNSFNSDWFAVLYDLGYMADALIYIFLQSKVRKQLFSCCKRQEATEPSIGLSSAVVTNV